ncbi:cobyric acid synthase CobQ [Arthrospira platensis]|uniref:cobyric acid synthase CobQ n=1 Tax=Limnospira platensis TaxID=118562 RepID=UPI0016838108|nr:cobyric acid synthase CobQ [Arthrospira platensis]MBD2573788.1 cobyric acid synthase CobQ [Arthrospira platensis FACHB-971]MBD2710780.1 cobyric acid synthase CobQ [Arthrospira platensis FACHB-835]
MKAIMVVGTTSHAGKSMLVTALCRIIRRQNLRVVPFKGQNMALNSYVTATGAEMGYAQAVQSWAAGLVPNVAMNPILLKPQGNMTSQVILKGKPVATLKATEYYEKFFDTGWETITKCLDYLQKEFDVIVCEGAGSPAEINLKHRDLTNMRVAQYLQAFTILIVDIDRGGAFAHVVGTLELLDPEERALIKGIVINKFRGMRSLLDSGIEWLEKYTGIPVLGVIPWVDIAMPAEDSLSLLERRSRSDNTDITIAIVRIPRISNFTDFDPLDAESTVKVQYVELNEPLGHPDAVIIPGSKTTIADLLALQKSGMAAQIQDYVEAGGQVMGICGGYQMLGQQVSDPRGLEGKIGEFPGLGLLPIKTMLLSDKVSRQRLVTSNYPEIGFPVEGYEIHQGRTQILDKRETAPLFDDEDLGVVSSNRSVWGHYLHGIFDNSPWRRSWLNHLRKPRGLGTLPTGIPNYREQRDLMLDTLADVVEEYLDLSTILG